MSAGFVSYVSDSLQIVLGTVFLVAALGKLRKPSRFAAAIREYELVPSVLSGPLAATLVVVESLVGISLLSGWSLDVGLPVAGGLLVIFAVAVGINLRRGRAVPCGCFGSDTERITPRTLTRLGLLMLAAVALAGLRLLWSPLPLNVASLATGGTSGLERLAATAGFAAFQAVLAMWILQVPEISALLRRRSLQQAVKRP